MALDWPASKLNMSPIVIGQDNFANAETVRPFKTQAEIAKNVLLVDRPGGEVHM